MTTIFKKTPKQVEATKLMASNAKHIALLGGSRSGKTFQIVRSINIRASKVPSRHISLRQTFNSVKTSIFLDTLPKVLSLCFPDLPIKWNKSDHYITFPNGSEYWFGGLDDQKRIEKILGREFSTMHFNEITQMDFRSVQLALTRLAEKNDLAKKAYYDFNPSVKTHWSYYQFIKKLDPRDNEPLKKPDNYVWMKMNPMDNLENIDSEYLDMLESMPEAERIRFMLGEFSDESDGQVYYEFRREDHVKPVKKLPGTVFIATDFNLTPHCSIGFQFIDGGIRVIKEFFLMNSDTPRAIHEWEKSGFGGCIVIPDSTGRARRTNSGFSDFDVIKKAGFQIRSTHNPFIKDRVNNVNRCLKAGLITIDPSCKKLINDLERVSWKNNDIDPGPEKMLGHITDALGYACHNLLPQIKLDLKPTTARR